VVVLNSEKVRATGNKETDKKYYRHSGYIGHLKIRSLEEQRIKNPMKILESSVSGMLPKTRLRAPQLKRLFLVIGNENPHTAQKPEILNVPTS
jgi:large subunit ribosomal protein L13